MERINSVSSSIDEDVFRCIACGETKSIIDFPKHRSSKRGHRPNCRLCYNAYYRDYYKNKPDKYQVHKEYVKLNDEEYKKLRKRANFHKHGLTEDEFLVLLEEQNYLCKVCKIEVPTAIDHDHTCCVGRHSCGECVRGILCNNCNSVLGFSFDNPKILENAIQYLNESQ